MSDAPAPARVPQASSPAPINLEANPTEENLITDIVDRYLKLIDAELNAELRLELRMDLTACHLNGTPLRLQELVEASDFTLAHDVQGINRFIDRTTGKLTDHHGRAYSDPEYVGFAPRFEDNGEPKKGKR